MGRTVRRGLWVLGAAALLTASGCGSSSPKASSARHGTTKSASSTSSTTTTTATNHGNTGTSSGSSGSPSGSSHSAAGTPAPAGSSGTPSGPGPATPGTYTYSQTGQTSFLGTTQKAPAQGTIVVEAPSAQGPGAWSQEWESYVDPSQSPSDTTFAITPSGISVVTEVISMDGQSFTCTFSPPLQVLDWPPTVGYQFSGTGNCGSFTAHASGKIAGTQTVTVGGSPVSCFVIDTDVTTTGSVSATSTETDWFDPTAEVDAQQQASEQGSYDGVSFTSTLSRQLLSTKPS